MGDGVEVVVQLWRKPLQHTTKHRSSLDAADIIVASSVPLIYSNGQAVFSDKVPEQQHELEIPNVGTVKNIYSTYNFPMDLSSEDDIEKYGYDRVIGNKGILASPIEAATRSAGL